MREECLARYIIVVREGDAEDSAMYNIKNFFSLECC